MVPISFAASGTSPIISPLLASPRKATVFKARELTAFRKISPRTFGSTGAETLPESSKAALLKHRIFTPVPLRLVYGLV